MSDSFSLQSSSFIGSWDNYQVRQSQSRVQPARNSITMYENEFDPPSKKAVAKKHLASGFWKALDYTEKWVAENLSRSKKDYQTIKKEVCYDCELNLSTLGSIAGIFRRFKEANQRVERYKRSVIGVDLKKVKTWERTHVLIMPFCDLFGDFESFHKILNAIENARSNAKSLVTNGVIDKKMDAITGNTDERDWNVAINGTSLHPDFNYHGVGIAHRRQSPYPTLVIDLKVKPIQHYDKVKEPLPVASDVQKLESLFALSAAIASDASSSDGHNHDIFDSLANTEGINELVLTTPMDDIKEWVQKNDPLFEKELASFTSSKVKDSDAAFEYVFLNLSLHKYRKRKPSDDFDFKAGPRSYLVIPNFLSYSATSFERFTKDIQNILSAVDGLNERVSVDSMHPENIEDRKRSPHPLIILQWYDEVEN